MIKKIDANKYGVVRYAISSIEDIADLPREVSVGSEAILVNEDGEKKFRLGSDGWVEVVEVKEYDEDKLRDMLEDAKVGYGGIEYETLEERLDKDFDNAYSVLDNRAYVGYEGCRITAKDSLNGLQKETVVKGRTLQNLLVKDLFKSGGTAKLDVNVNTENEYNVTVNSNSPNSSSLVITKYLKVGFKIGATYTVMFDYYAKNIDIKSVVVSFFGYDSTGKMSYLLAERVLKYSDEGKYVRLITTISTTLDVDVRSLSIGRHSGLSIGAIMGVKNVMLLEGDYTQTPLEELPFVEGIQSVGNKSKNLFDYNKLTHGYYFNPATGEYEKINVGCTTGYIKFNKCNITISGLYNQVSSYVGYYDINYNYIGRSSGNPVTEHKLTVGSVIADSSYRGYDVPANAEYIALNIYRNLAVNPDVTIEMIKENIKQVQIEEGSQATAYEPYYDGYKISGKSCGRNLFDIKKVLPTGNGMVELIEDGLKITRITDATHDTFGASYEIKLKPNTKYTIKADVETSKQDVRFLMYSYEDKLFGNVSLGNGEFGKWQTLITTKNGNCIIGFYFNSSPVANWEKGDYAIIKNIQLEETTSLTPYEPYRETTYSYILDEPLRSLPNGVCDEIDLEKGVVTRRVGKVVITENTRIALNNAGTDYTQFVTHANTFKGVSTVISSNIWCDTKPVFALNESNNGFWIYDGTTGVFQMTENINTVALMQEWLKNNPTTVYYELANPITEYLIKDDKFVTLPNGVKDEVGRIVTRNVGKVVLNGSENWWTLPDLLGSADTVGFQTDFTNSKPSDNATIEIICDTLTVYKADDLWYYEGTDNICSLNKYNKYQIRVNKNELSECTVEGFKKWLSQNPLTVYHQLRTPYIECSYEEYPTLPNGVKDEVSYNSVLRKVGKVVIDGSQVLTRSGTNANKTKTTHFMVVGIEANSPYGICDKLPTVIGVTLQGYEEPCMELSSADRINPPYMLWLNIDRSNADTVEEAYEYFRNNPHTVWYELITPYVEPINLDEVILDTTRLKSYEPITHITSDNYLLPTIKTQVPSDFNAVVLGLKSNNEALASQVMSLRQTNDELEATNREQDDVIDVTLLALDEVYGMIDEGEIETMSVGSPMVNVYVKMIKRGIKTLDEVPAKYRAEVEELI